MKRIEKEIKKELLDEVDIPSYSLIREKIDFDSLIDEKPRRKVRLIYKISSILCVLVALIACTILIVSQFNKETNYVNLDLEFHENQKNELVDYFSNLCIIKIEEEEKTISFGEKIPKTLYKFTVISNQKGQKENGILTYLGGYNTFHRLVLVHLDDGLPIVGDYYLAILDSNNYVGDYKQLVHLEGYNEEKDLFNQNDTINKIINEYQSYILD